MTNVIREKVFSWSDQFAVKDELGNDRYLIKGEIFSLGKKLHILDMLGREIASIKQELLTFMPCYHVWVGGADVAQIVNELTFLRPKYEIARLGWEINGDLWEHWYQILCGGHPIVSIQKAWMMWGDTYELDIVDPKDELMALAVVLAIDCVLEDNDS